MPKNKQTQKDKEENKNQEQEEQQKGKIISITPIQETEEEGGGEESEEEQEEGELEEDLGYQPELEDSGFSDFVSGERAIPILEQGELEIPDASIEDIAATAPPTQEAESAFDYATGKAPNEPDYSGSGKYETMREDERNLRNMRESGVLTSAGESGLHEIRPIQQQTGWGSELENLREQSSKYQDIMQQDTANERRELPFNRKSRLKERRL